MMGMSNLWQGLRNAPMFESGTYFQPGGMFDVQVISCLAKQTQKSGICFIAETEILQSSLAAHAQGSKASWIQSMSKPAIAMPNIKSFICAVLGFSVREDAQRITNELEPVIEGLMDRALSAENPLGKFLVHVETTEITTKEKRQPFTVHRWSPFAYEAYGMTEPGISHLLRPYRAPAPAYQPQGYGAPPPAYQPQGYGAPPPVYNTSPAYQPTPGPVVERTPDGYYQRVNGGPWTLIPR